MNARSPRTPAPALLCLLLLAPAFVVRAQEPFAGRADSASVSRRLASHNPAERRGTAEELARLAAVEHRRLVEGYRVQEKDAAVKNALDWALYRMGRNESLFPLVRALDSKKQAEQAVGYLKQLESPQPLYVFLGRVNGNTQIRLLEVLASLGDRDTLERIRPLTQSLDPGIADAAKFAEREITIRLEETPTPEPKRQRRTGQSEDDPPR
jgi:hypothetical protein